MHPPTLSLLFSSLHWMSSIFLSKATNITSMTDLVMNPLIASYECSHHGKEWRICTQPDGWGSMFYCPASSEYNETELETVEWGEIGKPTPLMPCFTCPGADSNCSVVVMEVLNAYNIALDQNSTLGDWSIWDEAQSYCEDLCESRKQGESCSQDSQCTPGALFCDYATNDTDYIDGTCKSCPANTDDCFQEGFATSLKGRHNCRDCRLYCDTVGASKVWVDGEVIMSQPIATAIQSSHQSASGLLYDCSDLILDPESSCQGAEGKMCLVEYRGPLALPFQVSNQAEKSGCVGIIAFIDPYDLPISNSNSELLIPYVYVSLEEGQKLLNSKIGVTAKVEVDIFGAGCYPEWESDVCSASWLCDKGKFCEFNNLPTGKDDLFTDGYCRPCPEDDTGELDPLACYFDNHYDGLSSSVETVSIKTVQKVQSCAASCGAELTSKGCKFCTSQVTGFEFGVDKEEDKCLLCPQYDVQYPDRIVPLFGDNVSCSQLESFFQMLPVPKDSRNCQLAQSMNFICGCDGTGYAGANTVTKQAVLAWMPRVAAIFSILGSLFIIVDTQRTRLRRSKLINQILCTVGVFDVVGSFAMAFTTLPTPETDYIYGSKGSAATCTAQGFLIQMGTIACFLSASLASYYNLTIKQGWTASRLKRNRIIYFLLVPPVLVGLTYAGAGIPYYNNVIIWCNNSARWWPEVPVIIAILSSTVIMGDVVYSVYKTEKASSQYNGRSNNISKVVFKQAMCFVGAFYITWVPYLALQFMWSSGIGYGNYGLILAAATLVPLQGFWNFCVYIFPRHFKGRSLSVVRSTIGAKFIFVRRLWTIRSTSQRRNATSTAEAKSTTSASMFTEELPIINNRQVAMESDILQLATIAKENLKAFDEEYDADDVCASSKHEVVLDDAPDLNHEPEFVPPGSPDSNYDHYDAPDPNEDNEDARYEMMLAG